MNFTDYHIPAIVTPKMAINQKIVDCINFLNSLEFKVKGVSYVTEVIGYGIYEYDLSQYEIDEVVKRMQSAGWEVSYHTAWDPKGVGFHLAHKPDNSNQPNGCDI